MHGNYSKYSLYSIGTVSTEDEHPDRMMAEWQLGCSVVYSQSQKPP